MLAERLLRIGADTSDDEETRLDKVLVLSTVAMIAPLAAVWGVLYLAAGAPRAAAIPLLYVAIAAAGAALFARHRSLPGSR